MTDYIETYMVDFNNQKLYIYNSNTRDLDRLSNVSFFPQMISQEVEKATDGESLAHVLRINLRTLEIVDRSDSVGTGFNSGMSSHDVMAGTCRWTNPLI